MLPSSFILNAITKFLSRDKSDTTIEKDISAPMPKLIAFPDIFSSSSHFSSHFPTSPTSSELINELVMFLIIFFGASLQFLHIYRTVWRIPETHINHTALATYRPSKAISYAIDYLHHRPYGSKSTNNSKFCRGKKCGKKGKRSSDRWKRGSGSKKKLIRKPSAISPVALIADKDGPKVALIPINLFEEGQREEGAFRDALSILALLTQNSHEVQSFMESTGNLRRSLASNGPSITEITEEDIEQLDKEILEKNAVKQPVIESKYFTDGSDRALEIERVENHTLPKDMLRELQNVSISGMQINFEMNMTNIRDAILNPENLKEVGAAPISDVGDSRLALSTNIQVYPDKGKTVPLQLNALIHGTVSIDPEKFSREELKRLQVSQFNEYVTAVAANLCSKALKKGFPMNVSRNFYTSAPLSDSERGDSYFKSHKETKAVEGGSEENSTRNAGQGWNKLSSSEDESVDYMDPKHAYLDVLLSRSTPTAGEAMMHDEHAQAESGNVENVDNSAANVERLDETTEENAVSTDRGEGEAERRSMATDKIEEVAEMEGKRSEEGVNASASLLEETDRHAGTKEMMWDPHEEDAEAMRVDAAASDTKRTEGSREQRDMTVEETEEAHVDVADRDMGAKDLHTERFHDERRGRIEMNERIVEQALEHVEATKEYIGNAGGNEISETLTPSTEDRIYEAQASEGSNTIETWEDSVEPVEHRDVLGDKTRPLEINSFEEEPQAIETEATESGSPYTRVEVENHLEDEPNINILENEMPDEIRFQTENRSTNHKLDELDRRIQRFLQNRMPLETKSKSFHEAQGDFERKAVALEKNAHALEEDADVLEKLVDAPETPDDRLQTYASNNPISRSVQSEMDKSEIARQIELSKRFDGDLGFSKYTNEKFESKRTDEDEAYTRDEDELATTFYGKIGLEDRVVNQTAEDIPPELEDKINELHTQFKGKLDTFKGLPASYAIALNTATAIPGKGDETNPPKSPHIVCVRKGAKGCKSPGLADNAPYVAKKTSAKDTGSKRSGVSLQLLECGLYQKALDEAASKRRATQCGRRSSSSTSKSKSGSGGKKGSSCGSTPPCQNKEEKQKLPPAPEKASKSNDPCTRSSSKPPAGSSKRSSSCSSKSGSGRNKGSSCGSTPPCQNKSEKQKLPPAPDKSSKSNDPCTRSSPKPPAGSSKRSSSCSSKSGSGTNKGSSCGSTPPCQNKREKQKLPPISSKSKSQCEGTLKFNDPCKQSSSAKPSAKDSCMKSSSKRSKSSDSCKRSSCSSKKKRSASSSSKKSDLCKKSSPKSKDPCKRSSSKSKDPCKRTSSKSKDPCKRSTSTSSNKSDPCKRSSSKSKNPCKRSSSKSKDPCKRSTSSSSTKSDPCKKSSFKSKDPCKRSSSSGSKKSDLCKRSSSKSDDLCRKSRFKDPCKRSSSESKDPCKRSSSKSKDPCKRSSSSSSKKLDPCKRSSSKSKDPCGRSSSKSKDPCKRSSSKSKDPCKRSSSKSKDPCKRSSSKSKDPCKTSSFKSKDPCKRSSSKSKDPYKRSSSKSKDPCKRSSKLEDPCKRSSTSSSKKSDPCKRSSSKSKDPCKRSSSKSKDPCKRSSSKSKDPCKRSSSSIDPCKRSSSSSSKKSDPCKMSSSKSNDPCHRSSSKSKDPCKRSSSSTSKKSSTSCSSKSDKSDKCPVCTPKRKCHSLVSMSTPLRKQLDVQIQEVVRCFSDDCPPKEGKTNYLPRNPHTNDIRKATCQKFSWRDDRKRRKLKKEKKNCYPDETIGMCPDTDCYRIYLTYEGNKRDQRKKRCARRKESDKRKKGTRENKMGSKRSPLLSPLNCVAQKIRCFSSECTQNEKAVILSPHKVCKKKVPLKPIKENDVCVCIDCVALSDSDIHMFETGAKKYPQITLGNEASGIVQEVGKNVRNLKPGDHVALECGVPCGGCQLCHSGRYNLCEQLTFRGCLKKYCTHPASFCHKIIKRVPLAYASLVYQLSLGCNACRQAGIKPNSNVAIIGSCATTLCTAMCASAMGCSNICVICTTENTQDIVAENITENVECIDSQTSVKGIYRMICDSLGTNPDIVINCLCSTKTMNAAIMALKPAGTCVVSGFLSECVAHNVMDGLMKEIRIVPSFRSRNMFPLAMHLLERKQVPIACLIADCLEWKDLEAGFEKALTESNSGPRKVVIQCREDDEGDGDVGVKKNKLLIF